MMMKKLKLLLLSIAIFSGGILTAQEDVNRELKINGDLIEVTYYHDNGEIAQTGFYKNEKPHGEWIAFDREGNKTALGKYTEGVKTGKWFFWNDETLSEVDYSENRIASVSYWKNDSKLASN